MAAPSASGACDPPPLLQLPPGVLARHLAGRVGPWTGAQLRTTCRALRNEWDNMQLPHVLHWVLQADREGGSALEMEDQKRLLARANGAVSGLDITLAYDSFEINGCPDTEIITLLGGFAAGDESRAITHVSLTSDDVLDEITDPTPFMLEVVGPSFPNLKALSFSGPCMKQELDEDWKGALEALPASLTAIHVDNTAGFNGFTGIIPDIQDPEYLHGAILAHRPHALRALRITNAYPPGAAPQLPPLPNLHHLEVCVHQLKGAAVLSMLDACPNLHSLAVHGLLQEQVGGFMADQPHILQADLSDTVPVLERLPQLRSYIMTGDYTSYLYKTRMPRLHSSAPPALLSFAARVQHLGLDVSSFKDLLHAVPDAAATMQQLRRISLHRSEQAPRLLLSDLHEIIGLVNTACDVELAGLQLDMAPNQGKSVIMPQLAAAAKDVARLQLRIVQLKNGLPSIFGNGGSGSSGADSAGGGGTGDVTTLLPSVITLERACDMGTLLNCFVTANSSGREVTLPITDWYESNEVLVGECAALTDTQVQAQLSLLLHQLHGLQLFSGLLHVAAVLKAGEQHTGGEAGLGPHGYKWLKEGLSSLRQVVVAREDSGAGDGNTASITLLETLSWLMSQGWFVAVSVVIVVVQPSRDYSPLVPSISSFLTDAAARAVGSELPVCVKLVGSNAHVMRKAREVLCEVRGLLPPGIRDHVQLMRGV